MGAVTRWWWVRHAPVTANQGCCYGQTDFPCEIGDETAFAALARNLPREAVWVASPLQRTHMTAAALIAAGADGPSSGLLVEPDFIEQHFGAWQGQRYAELTNRRGDEWHRFWLAPADETPPGGESFAALTARVHDAVARWNERYPGRDIVSVGHGGTIRAALAQALALSPAAALAFSIDNLSLTRLDHFAEPGAAPGWRIAAVNQPPR